MRWSGVKDLFSKESNRNDTALTENVSKRHGAYRDGNAVEMNCHQGGAQFDARNKSHGIVA